MQRTWKALTLVMAWSAAGAIAENGPAEPGDDVRISRGGTVVEAGHLVDPATGEVAHGQRIVIDADGRITAVGPDVEAPPDAVTVDLSGGWVMPGLMDAHTHLTFGYPASPQSGKVGQMYGFLVREGIGLRALRGARQARVVLEAGFTTVKDLGAAPDYVDTDLRLAIERGWFDGPTILNAGKIIAPYGGQHSRIAPHWGETWRFSYIDADTPDEVRKAVRQNVYYGARAIKMVADQYAYFYSEEEIRAAVEEAHRAGLTVTVHVAGDKAARNVILGGADAIEHGPYFSDETLQLMKEYGTVLVGTDFPEDHLVAMSGEEVGKRQAAAFHDRLRRAHALDVPMAFGSDVVVDLPDKDRGEMMLDYLDVWEAAGIPPAKILRCWTTNVARLLAVDGERGAIAAGQMADIIAIAQDPLADVQALRGIYFVMKNGKVIRHDGAN